MKLLTPMEKSNSTLCSTSSMVSSSNNSAGGGGSNGGQNGDHSNISSNISDTDSELSYDDCDFLDVTLVDDVDYKCIASNDAEKMLLQVMEVLRDEQEVCNFILNLFLQ